ncbi:protealysin inhibitor emfourin [Microbacterium sp. NPDC090225]|uniref:protealysin inhibitor emfourin n=1 Tax=Microbacterium sp. NPDC090225 TaxID=3364207 RepID=UPI00382CF832
MSESPQPTDAESSAAPESSARDGRSNDPGVIIAVVRSGGIAGISRRWRVEIAASDSPDAEPWIALIERCPWSANLDDSGGADRFVWSIRARTPTEHLERELPDGAVAGPWRDLVDAVRAASA